MALSRRSEGGGFHHPSHSTDYTALILIITLLFAVSFVRTGKYTDYLSTGDLRHFRIFGIEVHTAGSDKNHEKLDTLGTSVKASLPQKLFPGHFRIISLFFEPMFY